MSVQNSYDLLIAQQKTTNNLVSKSAEGVSYSNKMASDINSLYNNAMSDESAFAQNNLADIKKTSSEINADMTAQHKTLSENKQTIDNQVKSLETQMNDNAVNKTNFSQKQTSEIEKNVNSTIQKSKKNESNFNSTIKSSKTKLDNSLTTFNNGFGVLPTAQSEVASANDNVNYVKSSVSEATSATSNFLSTLSSTWEDVENIDTDTTDLNTNSILGVSGSLTNLITIDDTTNDLINESQGLLENVGISGGFLNDFTLGGDAVSNVNVDTVSNSISSTGAGLVNEDKPTISGNGNVNVTIPTESAIVLDSSGNQIATDSASDTAAASFNGIDLQNQTTDVLSALRTEYYSGNNKQLSGFIAPWDGRLGTAYTNSQSIGNHMPYGEEWVGSPSLMNPYALIRFNQVAGKNHHKQLIDQRGTFDFKSSRLQPTTTLKELSDSKINYTTTTNSNGSTVIVFDAQTAAKMGITTSDEVKQDANGALYIDEVDTGTTIWKPGKDGKTATGALVTEPVEVEVVNNAEGNLSALLKQAEISYNKSMKAGDPEFDKATTKAQLQANINEQNKKEGGSDVTVYTPNQAEYWYQKEGWVRCPENGGPYTPRAYCEGNKIKSGTVEEKNTDGKTEAQTLKEELERVAKIVQTQTAREWTNSGYAKNKRYLKTPGSSPMSMSVVEPLTSELVNSENWRGREQFIYSWSDFLYCTNYGIPNNYLITLRRFPVPVNDAAVVPKQDVNHEHILPVARAVTWLGDETGNKISELLSFSTEIKWKDMPADVNEVQGNEQGAESSPFGAGLAKWLGRIDAVSGGGKFGQVSGWDEDRAKFDPYKDGEYAGRIYGPVNVIDTTKMRDRGVNFTQDMSINFSYSLKMIGGVNPKAALLDILANFLALTYNNANFWGGANRYFPNKPQYPFLGGERGFKAWYKGDVTGFIDGLSDQLTSAVKDFGSMLMGLLTNPAEALKKLATGGAKVWMAEKQRDKRPGILAFKALLTGEPVGEWHLVIGNPFNPILMIGNLIVDNVSYSFGGGDERLGPDDFPETLNITVGLKHGRPRDKGDIESMFNRGQGRLHYSYYGKTEPWNSTQATKNVAIMKAATTYEDNFDGKTKSISGKLSMSDYSTVGQETGNVKTATSNVLGATSTQAYSLAAKVGYKSGS